MTERERIAKEVYELHAAAWQHKLTPWESVLIATRRSFLLVADYILREREKREAPLVAVLTHIASDSGEWLETSRRAQRALDDHAALSAPPARTLREEVEAMLASAPQIVYGTDPNTSSPLDCDGVKLALVRPGALARVRAALERERER